MEIEPPISPKAEIIQKIRTFLHTTMFHFEAIVLKFKTGDKYDVIMNQILIQTNNLKHIFQLMIEYLSLESYEFDDPESIKKFKDFKATPEELRRGPNIFMTHFTVDYLEKELIEPAFKSWLAKGLKRLLLHKKMCTLWRKLQIFNKDISKGILSEAEDLTNQERNSAEWKEMEKITTFISLGSKEVLDQKYEEGAKFLVLIQIAFARTLGTVPDLERLSVDELTHLMTPYFWDYEDYMRERGVFVYERKFTKNFSPKLGSIFWKNLLSATLLSKDDAKTEKDFLVAFCNKDSIKEYWNMTETYVAAASRSFTN